MSSAIGTSAASASAAGRPRSGPAIAQARKASARKAPATGLATALSGASTNASANRSRCAASSAPSAIARPRSKGTRLDSSEIDAPIAKKMPATRVARGGKCPSISALNSAVASVIDSAARSCGPISAPSAGASSE